MLETLFGPRPRQQSNRPPLSRDGLVIAKRLAWPYQSIWSDAALVVGLNATGALDARRVTTITGWKTCASFLNEKRQEAHWNWPTDKWEIEEWSPQPMGTCFRRRLNDPEFRFCRPCLSAGYHSTIHMLPWITHCPFHTDQELVKRCRSCRDRPVGSLLNARTRRCTECGTTPVEPLKLAKRRAPPPEGIALIDEYLRFISAVSVQKFHDMVSFRRIESGKYVVETRPVLHRAVEGDDRLADEVPIAVSLLAEILGFNKLRQTIMRKPLPRTKIIRAPLVAF